MIKKAFAIVCDKVFAALEAQGFAKQKIANDNADELVSLFTSDSVAYSVIYYVEKKHMVLRTCTMTDDGPDNEWKTLGTWMFDPEVDTEKEANSIGNDFSDTVAAPVAVKRVKQTKKKKSGDDQSNDPIFLSKRLVKLFPELKDEIKFEQDYHESFRAVTFFREKVVPKVNELVKRGSKSEITKLVEILSAQYLNGDFDTRSIITMVILNSVDPQYYDTLRPMMSDDLLKGFNSGIKYRNKKVKPEKVKVVATGTGEHL